MEVQRPDEKAAFTLRQIRTCLRVREAEECRLIESLKRCHGYSLLSDRRTHETSASLPATAPLTLG